MNKEFNDILDICEHNEGNLSIAEAIYNADYRKIDQTYEQLQEENNRIKNAYDLTLKQLKCFEDENERLYKMKRDLEDYIIEQGWQEYVGEEAPKTIWHKVVDGDLPKEDMEIYCCYKRVLGLGYKVCSYFTDDGDKIPYFYYFDREEGWIMEDDVIAWVELPKYEG